MIRPGEDPAGTVGAFIGPMLTRLLATRLPRHRWLSLPLLLGVF